jgi:hypothetical protein
MAQMTKTRPVKLARSAQMFLKSIQARWSGLWHSLEAARYCCSVGPELWLSTSQIMHATQRPGHRALLLLQGPSAMSIVLLPTCSSHRCRRCRSSTGGPPWVWVCSLARLRAPATFGFQGGVSNSARSRKWTGRHPFAMVAGNAPRPAGSRRRHSRTWLRSSNVSTALCRKVFNRGTSSKAMATHHSWSEARAGTFGRWEQCGREIPEERLQAVNASRPFARFARQLQSERAAE